MSDMSLMDSNYYIVAQHQITRVSPTTKRTEVAWQVDYHDIPTNKLYTVVVPETEYPGAVATYIQSQRSSIHHVANLGTPPV